MQRLALVDSLEPRTLFSRAIRIMPLGDSITESFAPRESYRYDLWNDLINAGYTNINFVGSQHGVLGGNPANTNFDMDHEGHSGWTADQLLASLPAWASTYRPDIVLLHAGTNDMRLGQSVSSTIDDLGNIIDVLRQANPHVTVLLCKIIPNEVNPSGTAALDDAIPTLAQQKDMKHARVILVDQETGFDPNTDLFDGLHPNDSGEAKMASRFFTALKGVLPSAAPAAPANSTYLSSLTWLSSSNGLGPIERNRSNGDGTGDDGKQITLDGNDYASGLGVDANSRIDYKLNGRQTYFAADLGVDDEVGQSGSVIFRVYADGKRVFSSTVIHGGDLPKSIKLNIHGAKRLTLIVTDAGDGNTNDHADWADARLIV